MASTTWVSTEDPVTKSLVYINTATQEVSATLPPGCAPPPPDASGAAALVTARLQAATEAYNACNWDVALAEWTALGSAVTPESRAGLERNCGSCMMHLSRPADALAAFDRALELDPSAESHFSRGIALQALSRKDDALAAFRAATALDAAHAPSLVEQAKELVTAGDVNAAEACALAAVRIDPDKASYSTLLGFVLLSAPLPRAQDAVAAFERARELGDASSNTQHLYGMSLSRRATALEAEGDLERAEAVFTQAIAIEPTETRLFNRALLLTRTAAEAASGAGGAAAAAPLYARAADGFRAVLRGNSEHGLAQKMLGENLIALRDYSGAAEALTHAVRLLPRDHIASYQLGFALLEGGDPLAARAHFTTAIELDPAFTAAADALSVVSARLALGSGGGGGVDSSVAPARAAPIMAPTPQLKQISRPPSASATDQPHPPPPPSATTLPPPPPPSASSASLSRFPSSSVAILRSSGAAAGGDGALSATAPAPPAAAAAKASAASPTPAPFFLAPGAPQDGWDGITATLAELKSLPIPPRVDKAHKEAYLSAQDFGHVFSMDKPSFYSLPAWKRGEHKKKVGLF